MRICGRFRFARYAVLLSLSGIGCTGEASSVPANAYANELTVALGRWVAHDGFLTQIVSDAAVPEVNLWKTIDLTDDGTPGLAPIVRSRVPPGTVVLILEQSQANPDFWKITDGQVVGWVFQEDLASNPVDAALPNAAMIPVGEGVTTQAQFESSAFCRAFGCALGDSWGLAVGGTNHSYDTRIQGFSLELQTEGQRLLGAGLSVYERAKDASGHTLFRPDDLERIDAFVMTFTGQACPDAAQLVRQNASRPFHQIDEAPAATCKAWEIRAGQISNPVISLKRQGP